MRSHTTSHVVEAAKVMLVACRHVQLITGGVGGMLAGLPIAEKLQLPFLEAHLQPLGPPTAAFAGVLMPHVPGWAGPIARRVSHRISAAALRLPFAPATRAVRAELLGPASAPDPRRDPRRGMPAIYGYSRHVVPPAPEWGPRRHVTGYWRLPVNDSWQPPAALQEFLDSGAPPVCIGFGSMAGADPVALTDLVAEASRRAGVRSVLLTGWGGLRQPSRDSSDVFVLDEAPHSWLLTRCRAVVHHGGAGTTGAGFTAGIPQVVVPFGVDQPFWGSRVAALGAGPAPIARRGLTVTALERALRAVCSDTVMQSRARDLGTLVRAEDGIGRAVEVITGVRERVEGE